MNNFYSGPRDPRPKRRKSEDNPYTIFSVGIDTSHPRFFVEFIDGTRILRQEEISKEVFDYFEQCELEDLAQMNVMDRHRATERIEEVDFSEQTSIPRSSIEEETLARLDQNALKNAVMALPEIPRRRFILRYFNGLTLYEIAHIERCTKQAVHESLGLAVEIIQKNFRFLP